MYRKILAGAAAVALILGAAAAPAQNAIFKGASITASADTFEDFEYAELDDGTVEISKYIGKDVVVAIPAEIDRKKVTSIGPMAFEGRTKLKSITIPEGVTYIGRYAFTSCIGLTKIDLPEGLEIIDEWAFDGCINLEEISFPSTIREIGLRAFYYTAWIEKKKSEDPLVIVNNILIDASACTGSVVIPDGVTRITRFAFDDCVDATDIYIPASVTDIEDFIFPDFYSPNFSQITVDENNPNYSSFDGVLYNKDMTELIECPVGKTSVSFPDSVTKIKMSAFIRCNALTSIDLPNSLREISDYAFADCTGLTSFVIPEGTKIIGAGVFEDCTYLSSLVIPEGVTSIGSYICFDCRELKSVTIPASVTEIGGDAFGYGTGPVPELEDWSDHLKFEDFIIRGYKGTAAEKYAKENDFTFIALDGGDSVTDSVSSSPDSSSVSSSSVSDSSSSSSSSASSSSSTSSNGSSSASSSSKAGTAAGGTSASKAAANKGSDPAAATGIAAGAGSLAILAALGALVIVKKKDE